MAYLTDFFDVTDESLQGFGGFNISLINDLLLFINQFLIFGNDKPEYTKSAQKRILLSGIYNADEVLSI